MALQDVQLPESTRNCNGKICARVRDPDNLCHRLRIQRISPGNTFPEIRNAIAVCVRVRGERIGRIDEFPHIALAITIEIDLLRVERHHTGQGDEQNREK